MDTQQQSLPRQFFEELKRRRVIRVATLYVLALWPIIQIFDILSPAIGLPTIAMRYMLIIFVAGLPIALILSWLYDLNRGGIVRPAENGGHPGHPLIGRSAEITVISVLLVAIALLFYLQSTLDFEEAAPIQSSTAGGPHSIAVLPFVSFSEKREDELFSDGLTEELLNALSQIKHLRVIARTTSFSYKGVSKNVKEIGEELNVSTILEGSVRRNDVENTIRVTAQLIDTATGSHLWSDTFDREFRDIFRIQDGIAAAVVKQLNLALAEDETHRLQSRETANPEAMVAYGMGRTALSRRTSQSLTDAERYFQQAIANDQEYAAAHAGLAMAYSLQANLSPSERSTYLTMAQLQVDAALALDPNSGVGWAAQGLVHMIRSVDDPSSRSEARAALSRAIELNPNLAMANMWYGNLMDDPVEKQRFHALAFELDPRSPVAGYNLASDLLLAGREGEAMEIFSRIVEADPNYPGAYQLIAQINEFRGRLSEAIRNYEKMYWMQPTSDVAVKLATLWVDIGDYNRADEWTGRVEGLLPAELNNEIVWLRIANHVARSDRSAAELLMQPMLDRPPRTVVDYMNAARAGYFLGDYERAVSAFESLQSLETNEDQQIVHGLEMQALEMKAAMAYAYRKLGREEEATLLLDDIENELTTLIAEKPRVNPNSWFVLAQVSAIRGENNLALIHLQRAVDEGWRQHWRPRVEPSFEDVVMQPAFVAMMQGLTTRMDLIREQIAFDESLDRAWRT